MMKVCVVFATSLLLKGPTLTSEAREPIPYIVGDPNDADGSDVEPGKYPYFVQVQGCGASLISEDTILLAAHCGEKTGAQVSVGASKTGFGDGGAQSRFCEKWIKHPRYDISVYPAFEYDFALCKLDRPVQIDKSKVTLVLNEDDDFPVPGHLLTVMGMGTANPNPNHYMRSEFLQEVSVPAWDQFECGAFWFESFNDNLMCAGWDVGDTGAGDACLGDSGGPLISRLEQQNGSFVDTMVGVVSFGVTPCAQPGKPTVYGRISKRFKWIQKTMCDDLGSTAEVCDNLPFDGECAYTESSIDIGLQPDKWPEETYWKLWDSKDNLVEERGPFLVRDEMSFSHLCVTSNECFTLEIFDTAADGIFNENIGKNIDDVVYTIGVNSETVVSSHGIFESKVSVDFCTPTVAPSKAPTISPSITPTRAPILVPEQCPEDIMLIQQTGETDLPDGTAEIVSQSIENVRVKVNQFFTESGSTVDQIYYQYSQDFLQSDCYEKQDLAGNDYLDITIKCTQNSKVALLELWVADDIGKGVMSETSGYEEIPKCCHSTVTEGTPIIKYMLEFKCLSQCSEETAT